MAFEQDGQDGQDGQDWQDWQEFQRIDAVKVQRRDLPADLGHDLQKPLALQRLPGISTKSKKLICSRLMPGLRGID